MKNLLIGELYGEPCLLVSRRSCLVLIRINLWLDLLETVKMMFRGGLFSAYIETRGHSQFPTLIHPWG